MRRSSLTERRSLAGPLKTRNDCFSSLLNSAVKQSAKKQSSNQRRSNNTNRLSNVAAPTPNKSFIPTLNSNNRNSRGSLACGRLSISRTDVKKDNRPLHDKSYQKECIKNLVDFLTRRNYPYPINSKMLVAPMNKDFMQIFEFLYQHLDPQFVLPTKLKEEEVLKALKQIRYPYTLTKSGLFTVGSRHSWPILLGCLNWLRELIEYTEMVERDVDSIMFPASDFENEGVTEMNCLYKFAKSSYSRYLSGEEYMDDDRQKIINEIARKVVLQDLPCDPDDDLYSEVYRLEQELKLIEGQQDPLSELKNKQLALKSDLIAYDEYMGKLNDYLLKRKAEFEKLSEEHECLKTTITSQEREIQEKEKIIKIQNISQHDIDLIRMKREELNRQITTHRQETAEYEKEINQFQMEVAQLNSQLEADCSKFNEIYKKISTECNSKDSGIEQAGDQEISLPDDFQIKVTFSQRHYLDWVNRIKPLMMKTKTVISEQIEKMKDRCIDLEEIKQQLLNLEAEQQERISSLTKELVDFEEQINQQRETFNIECQRLQTEEERLRIKIHDSAYLSSGESEMVDLEKRINDAERKLSKSRMLREKYDVESSKFMHRCYKKVQDHFADVNGLVDHFGDVCKIAVSITEKKRLKNLESD